MDVYIRFSPSGRSVRVPVGTTLLQAIRSAGLPIASACDAAALCGRCGVRVVGEAGDLDAESPAEAEAKRRNRVAGELRLACRIVPESDLEVTTPYW